MPRASAIRFIPTVVGNTKAAQETVHTKAVHPHGRGEHIVRNLVTFIENGSSPRSWGTRRHRDCAARRLAVHPHGRGEHSLFFCSSHAKIGSSPRSWGTQSKMMNPRPRARFIPTVVGNTFAQLLARWKMMVHPHGRGEHYAQPVNSVVRCGSSPRSWGTHCMHKKYRQAARFIPTVVGNTFWFDARKIFRTVHPHGRGEHPLPQPLLHR